MKVVGKAQVEIIKASGQAFQGSWPETRFGISLESDASAHRLYTTTKRRLFGFDFLRQGKASSSSVTWEEKFELPFKDLHDRLVVHCYRAVDGSDQFSSIGYVKIPLDNLLHLENASERWFQMIHRRNNSTVMVYMRLKIQTIGKNTMLASSRYELSDKMDEQGALKFFPSRDDLEPLDERNLDFETIETEGLVEFCYELVVEENTIKSVLEKRMDCIRLPSNAIAVTQVYPCDDFLLSKGYEGAVKSFSFPSGVFLCLREKDVPKPLCFSFTIQGTKRYGSVLIFYEKREPSQIYSPRALCLLSTLPFTPQFESFFRFTFEEYVKDAFKAFRRVDLFQRVLPMLTWFVDRCPLPDDESKTIILKARRLTIMERPDLLITLPQSTSSFDFPLYEHDISILFKILGISDISSIWSALLCEASFIVVSSQVSLLLPFIESIHTLCFPLKWPHTYIPIMPMEFATVLEAPVPFIVGCDRTVFDIQRHRIDDAVIIVDLDCGVINKRFKVELPQHISEPFFRDLALLVRKDLLASDANSVISAPVQKTDTQREIRKCFLKCLYSLLEGYRKHLMFSASNQTVFDVAAFLTSRDQAVRPFLSRLVTTSLFKIFVECHISRVNFFRDIYDYIMNYSSFIDDKHKNVLELEIPSGIQASPLLRSESIHLDHHIPVVRHNRHSLSSSFNSSKILKGRSFHRMQSVVGIASKEPKRRSDSFQMFLHEKSKIEFQRLSTSNTNIFQQIIQSLFEYSETFPFPFAELASAAELLKLGIWRSFLTSELKKRLEARQSSLHLGLDHFDAILFLSKFMLSECFFERDYGNCKRMLDLSNRVYRIGKDKEHRYLRDSFKDFKIFCQPDFWAYYMTIEILTKPYSSALKRVEYQWSFSDLELLYGDVMDPSRHRNVDLRYCKIVSKSIETVSWEDFVYSVLVGVFTVMESLDIAFKMIKICIIQLAEIQELSEESISDLCTLMHSLHQGRKALLGHFLDEDVQNVLLSPINERKLFFESNPGKKGIIRRSSLMVEQFAEKVKDGRIFQ